MKKIVIGLLLLAPLAYTSAQVTDNPIATPIQKARDVRNRMQEKQDQMQERLEDRKEQREEHREEIRNRVASTTRDRVGQFTNRVLNRFRAAIERMRNITDRIESRIAKIEDSGATLADAKIFLADARNELDEAENILATIPDTMQTVLDSDTPRENMASVRTLFDEAKTHLKNAREALSQAIASIKKGLNTRPTTTTDEN